MSFIKILFYSIILLQLQLFAQNNTLERVLKEKEIKVCVWPEYYGISYFDTRNQQFTGIDSDLAVELAKDLGVNLKFVNSSFATLIDDVTSFKCDIAMFAIGDTPQRREKVRFTTAHLSSDVYAITTKDNRRVHKWDDIDKTGNVVAVAKGTYHESIMKNKLKNAELLVVDKMHQREEEVQSGRADVFMTDYPFAKKMLASTSWAMLIEPNTTYQKTPYAWAMNYDDNEFYDRVEQFLKDIKNDGRLLKLAKKNSLEPIINLK